MPVNENYETTSITIADLANQGEITVGRDRNGTYNLEVTEYYTVLTEHDIHRILKALYYLGYPTPTMHLFENIDTIWEEGHEC